MRRRNNVVLLATKKVANQNELVVTKIVASALGEIDDIVAQRLKNLQKDSNELGNL